jgi:hypothetical protein
VHNLAYKIAFQHHLQLPSHSLLSSYHSERKQIALVNSAQSVKNGLKIFGFLKRLGATDPDISIAKERLFKKVRSKEEHDKREIEEGIEGQREHFDNHGLHIGYVYGDTQVPENASLYERRFVKGARLPHVWLKRKPGVEWMQWMGKIDSGYVKEFTQEGIEKREWSVLDLCTFDAFTLFIGKEERPKWAEVVQDTRRELLSGLKINVAVLSDDFEIVEGSKSDDWAKEMGLSEGGAVLVRPDQHILELFEKADAGQVIAALKGHLGL